MNQRFEHPAVVLGIRYGGYGVVRSLASAGIPVIAFTSEACPEAHTRLAEVRHYVDTNQLLRDLLDVARQSPLPPVLYLTSDDMAEFCLANLATLRERFLFHFPSSAATFYDFLHKDDFKRFAEKHGFRVPKTFVFDSCCPDRDALSRFPTPCVLKPFKRSAEWMATGMDKAMRFEDTRSLLETLGPLQDVDVRLVLQEWIPGGDDHIYFTLVYYADGECHAAFTGRKLRQWVPGVGTTSAAERVNEPEVEAETRRLFDLVNYSGFGSVEFKKHAITGEFVIMEPTVGRVEQQFLVAPANGVDLTLVAYENLTSRHIPRNATPEGVVYVDEEAEVLNLVRHLFRRELNLKALRRSYRRPKVFRYFVAQDLSTFAFFLPYLARRVASLLVREARRLRARDGALGGSSAPPA